jgi:hypothetical protein
MPVVSMETAVKQEKIKAKVEEKTRTSVERKVARKNEAGQDKN